MYLTRPLFRQLRPLPDDDRAAACSNDGGELAMARAMEDLSDGPSGPHRGVLVT
jgi:hypothetical protein